MLSFSQFLDYANGLTPGDQRGAVRSRIQHMQRLGFPPDMNSEGDRREWVSYDLDKAMLAGACIALIDAGMSLPRAVAATSGHVGVIRTSYAEVAAERYSLEGHVGPAHSRLLIERGMTNGQPVVRIDALYQDDAASILTLKFSAIIVDVRRLFDVLEETMDGSTAAIVRQATDVLAMSLSERDVIAKIPIIRFMESRHG